MNGQTIVDLLSHIPNFIGVFASDNLPTNVQLSEYAFIVNTDPSWKPGEHWQAVVIKENVCFFFDSFGGKPEIDSIRSFCKQFSNCYYNAVGHQSINEETCGAFCTFVVNEMMVKGKSFRSVVQTFHRIKRDDAYVRNYLLRNFSFHL